MRECGYRPITEDAFLKYLIRKADTFKENQIITPTDIDLFLENSSICIRTACPGCSGCGGYDCCLFHALTDEFKEEWSEWCSLPENETRDFTR